MRNEVYVSTKNFNTIRPSRKLDLKYAGPYKITNVTGNLTYKFKLPESLKMHGALHASLLQMATEPLPGQMLPPPPWSKLIKKTRKGRSGKRKQCWTVGRSKKAARSGKAR